MEHVYAWALNKAYRLKSVGFVSYDGVMQRCGSTVIGCPGEEPSCPASPSPHGSGLLLHPPCRQYQRVQVGEERRARRTGPARASGPQMVKALSRVAEIISSGLPWVQLAVTVTPRRLGELARYGMAPMWPSSSGTATAGGWPHWWQR